jgi:ATP phosphoribosyltransferase
MIDFQTRIVVDGNDGTGKSTLVQSLQMLGFRQVLDRGEMTRATDDPAVEPVPGTVYILLVCPWEESKRRLLAACRDMTDPYHQDEALIKYDQRFRDLATQFAAHVVKSYHPRYVLQNVLTYLGQHIRVGLPTGRLRFAHPALGLLNPQPRQVVCSATGVPVTGFLIRTKTYPQMVALGVLDVAIVGSDALEGNPWAEQCEVILRQPQGVRMVLAAIDPSVLSLPLLRVATPFGDWAARVLGEMGHPTTIFSVAGGSEALVASGLADVCFDIVETGDTLKANGLVILAQVGTLDTCVIRKRI